MKPNDATSGVVAVFRNDVKKNPLKSAEAGRPIFDDIEYVELRYPGSRDYGVYPAMETSYWDDDAVTGEYRRYTYAERFAKQYQQFRDHHQQTKAGTPLDYLSSLTEAKRAELRALNIYTVEALAIVDGSQLKNLGPNGRELKNKAVEFLASSSETAKITKLEAELEAIKARNEVLEDDIRAGLAAKPPVAPPTEYDNMTDAQLRDHVKSITGIAPKGQPSRQTLIRMAQENKPSVAA